MAKLEGGCLCGAVRYSSEAQPALVACCHCRNCQRATGSGHTFNVAVPADSVRITGETRRFQSAGGSGKEVNRVFCPECGSQLMIEASLFAGLMLIAAGTLDDPSWVEPGFHIWTSSAPPWDQPPAGAAAFPQLPPM